MLLSFATIYFITFQNVRADTDMELHRVSEFNLKPDGKMGNPQIGHGGGHPPQESKANDNPSPERSVSFMLQTDAQWKITATNPDLTWTPTSTNLRLRKPHQ